MNRYTYLLASAMLTLFLSSTVLGSVAAEGGSAKTTDLDITVSGIKGDKGSIIIAVYDNKKDWLGDNAVSREVVAVKGNIKDGAIKAVFALPPGEYAITLFHDVDGDGELKMGRFIPTPKEPMGLSNNDKTFGAPKYKNAKFQISSEKMAMNIELFDF